MVGVVDRPTNGGNVGCPPVDVSLLCTTATALIACRLVLRQPGRDRPGIGGPPIAFDELELDAETVGHLLHRVENKPVSNIRTLSPGDRVLTSAASQAPVPEAG